MRLSFLAKICDPTKMQHTFGCQHTSWAPLHRNIIIFFCTFQINLLILTTLSCNLVSAYSICPLIFTLALLNPSLSSPLRWSLSLVLLYCLLLVSLRLQLALQSSVFGITTDSLLYVPANLNFLLCQTFAAFPNLQNHAGDFISTPKHFSQAPVLTHTSL